MQQRRLPDGPSKGLLRARLDEMAGEDLVRDSKTHDLDKKLTAMACAPIDITSTIGSLRDANTLAREHALSSYSSSWTARSGYITC